MHRMSKFEGRGVNICAPGEIDTGRFSRQDQRIFPEPGGPMGGMEAANRDVEGLLANEKSYIGDTYQYRGRIRVGERAFLDESSRQWVIYMWTRAETSRGPATVFV